MRERKYVKFKVDMYEDTKFKIIDMKPERDVINYIWNRMVLLAGKVNLEGHLFLSKNIPYTIETLAIELNRNAVQIKLALEVFIELEMLELTEDKIYRVKNFAKHQNIKPKNEIAVSDQTVVNANKDFSDKVQNNKDEDKNSEDNLMEYKVKALESKKRTRSARKKRNSTSNKEVIGEIIEDDGDIADTSSFMEGVRPLGKGEISIAKFSFG